MGRGAGNVSAEVPAPGLLGGGDRGGPQGFETVLQRRRRLNGKRACRGARFLFFRISIPCPYTGFSGGILRWGGGGRPSRAGGSGRGVALQARGPFFRPVGLTPRLGVSAQTAEALHAEWNPVRVRTGRVLSKV